MSMERREPAEILAEHGIISIEQLTEGLTPARCAEIPVSAWAETARLAANEAIRWAGLWADGFEEALRINALLEHGGHYLLLRTSVSADKAQVPSHAVSFPAATRMERHAHDLWGITFEGHPDPRRWTRHQAWPEHVYPLRQMPDIGIPHRTPADTDYPFQRIQGAGICEIPVGPVHAGIIEPGHFRFQTAGEDVLALEERLGYVHKGIEARAIGRKPEELIRLATHVSGDSAVTHAWAACQAMERATGTRIPARAHHLRAILAERERVANHLGDIGAISNDVGFSFAHYQFGRLRELWQRRNGEIFDHRLLMDTLVPGGVYIDPSPADVVQLNKDLAALRKRLAPLFELLLDYPSLEDRLVGTGRLASTDARRLGALGYVGRASGLNFDVRRDAPYAPYASYTISVPVLEHGDVAARMRIRMEEILASLDLMDALLEDLPSGAIKANLEPRANSEGLGIVEGWRGETIAYLRFADDGTIARYFPRDPSWFNWPALEKLMNGNIVADFPVCNKSVNASYSGNDL